MKPVNLLPEEHRPRGGTGGRQGSAYVVLGVLGALFLATLLYVLTASQVSSRERDAARAQREAQQAEARFAALGAYGNFARIEQTRATSVKSLAGARFDWERLIRKLALVLPKGTWLTEVDASVVPSSEDAGAPKVTGPSAKIAGCAQRQPDVARLMVRLRRLHRVSDVTLTESAKEEQDSGGGAPVAGPGGASQEGCSGRYKFDLTVAFEALPAGAGAGQARVPASLGGG